MILKPKKIQFTILIINMPLLIRGKEENFLFLRKVMVGFSSLPKDSLCCKYWFKNGSEACKCLILLKGEGFDSPGCPLHVNTDLILYQFHRCNSIPFPPVTQSHFILNEFVKTPFNSSNSHVVAFASKTVLCYQWNMF